MWLRFHSDQRRSQQRERAARTFAVRYQARCVDLAQIRKTTTPDQNASLFDMAFAGNPNSDIPISTRPTAVVSDMFDWINIAPLVIESSLNFSTSSPISNLLVRETTPCQSQKDIQILQLQAELQTSRSELAAARAEILQHREDQLKVCGGIYNIPDSVANIYNTYLMIFFQYNYLYDEFRPSTVLYWRGPC